MIESVKITKVIIGDKSKDGKEFVTKAGKKFWKVAVKTDKYPNDWMSALAFAQDDAEMNLQEGDEVKIIVEQNGQYKNFKLPSRLDELEERVKVLEAFMRSGNSKPAPVQDEPPFITEDDIPF